MSKPTIGLIGNGLMRGTTVVDLGTSLPASTRTLVKDLGSD